MTEDVGSEVKLHQHPTDRTSGSISGFNERSQHLKILQIRTRIVVRCLKNESAMRELGMLSEPSQRLSADVPFANVPVTIDPRIVRRFRVVEVNRANILQSDGLFDY